MVAGITEPLDFSFLFISPLLWLVHGLLTGFSEMLLWVLGSRTYSIYGLLDTIVCNSVIDPKLSKIYIFFAVGIVMAIVWYFTFVFLIKKFDIKTPGREEESLNNDIICDSPESNNPNNQNAELFIEGLGGAENIVEVNNCFTRLRIDVSDINKVDKEIISKAKQKGVVIKGNNVQIIIGMTVESEKEKLVNVLNTKK
jgi:PTS system arbutin-like IIC component